MCRPSCAPVCTYMCVCASVTHIEVAFISTAGKLSPFLNTFKMKNLFYLNPATGSNSPKFLHLDKTSIVQRREKYV